MRHVLLLSLGLTACLGASPASASEVGLPTNTFVQTWTPLPTGRFTQASPIGLFEVAHVRAEPLPADARLGGLLDDAFASAGNDAERRGIALSEMTAPWDEQKRVAFQRLRAAEAAYAGADAARHERFAATLARVVDGTGRSAADDGPTSADLDKAYAAALARAPGDARVAAQTEQERWRSYADAFAAFADVQTPGSAAGVTAELGRQRVSDLAAGH